MNPTRPIAPGVRCDERGRMIPFTPEERATRAEALRAALEAMRAHADGPDEVPMVDVFRAIDGHRPERPLFEGQR